MARASEVTILSLDRFAQLAGIHPLHFNQVTVANLAPMNSCDDPLLQYSWQHADRVGREEIAFTIKEVEDLLAELLGYQVGPTWTTSERLSFTQPRPVGLRGAGVNAIGYATSLTSKFGLLHTGGKKSKTLIDDAVAIVYSDTDGDTYNETATITVNTTVTEPDELAIFYPDKDGDDSWEIRPLKSVSIANGVATIIFNREQAVTEDKQESLLTQAVNGLEDANFLTEVDVYRKFTDPSEQVTLLWEMGACGCNEPTCANCQFESQTGCLQIRDARLGIFAVSPAEWDADTETFLSRSWVAHRQPDQALISYKSGDSLRTWERVVTNLTLAKLDRPICACQALEAQIQHQREDFAYRQPGNSFQVSRRVLENPIGTQRAAVNAWTLVQRRKLVGV